MRIDVRVMADTEVVRIKTVVPRTVISYVDPSVAALLRTGSKIERISPHGFSNWNQTARILTLNDAGEEVSYFLKVSCGDVGKGMMLGEFTSMSALYQAMPDLVPQPISWGSYANDAKTYFFICAFRKMTGEVPGEAFTAVGSNGEPTGRLGGEIQRISNFTYQIARLHKAALSPTGKFGFPVTTYGGRLPQDTTFCDTWEESFIRGIQRMFDLEELQHGHDEDMVQLRALVVHKAIPRLLRPLETRGRSIAACLVHGDLWDGNTGVDRNTRKPVIFDACSSYAHHEYELAPWRLTRHKISGAYIAEYLKHYPASEPKEDFEARNALYCIRFNLCSSALYPGKLKYREFVKDEMKALLLSLFGDLEHAKIWQDGTITGGSARSSKL